MAILDGLIITYRHVENNRQDIVVTNCILLADGALLNNKKVLEK